VGTPGVAVPEGIPLPLDELEEFKAPVERVPCTDMFGMKIFKNFDSEPVHAICQNCSN
jgi:hypothetical protein